MPGDNDFDMAGAVTEIADGLGFDGEAKGTGDGNTDVTDTVIPSETPHNTTAETPLEGTLEQETDAAATVANTSAATSSAPRPADVNAPPKTWTKEAAADWAALPERTRAEIHKREEDMFRGIEGYKQAADVGHTFHQIVQPHLPLMQHFGVTPQQVIPGLLNAHATLTVGTEDAKLAILDTLIRDYHIPLPALLARLTGGALDDTGPYVDPAVKALRDELGQVKTSLSAREMRDNQEQQNRFRQEVQAFAADTKNAYFDELSDDIAQLIEKGVTKDLKVAYEKALWANPVVRAKELSRQAAEAESKRMKDSTDAAARARKAASVNVKSSARSGGPAAASSSIDETLAKTLAAINARG